jgi:hypothetical protein
LKRKPRKKQASSEDYMFLRNTGRLSAENTWSYIPEDRTLHSHCRERLKSYIEIRVAGIIKEIQTHRRLLTAEPTVEMGGKKPTLRQVITDSPRNWWVDNIKMDLGEIGWDGRDWIELAQDMDHWSKPKKLKFR